jgi:5-methyltetrahydrofolate--homocysteine methyltransferase
VKVAPGYHGTTVHVHDASRAVNVLSALLDPRQRKVLDADNRREQERLREIYAGKTAAPLVPYAEARERRERLVFSEAEIATPSFVGRRVIENESLDEIRKYIDWTFFFTAWELKGKFPHILDSPQYGAAARELYDNANERLDEIINKGWLRANAVYGFWRAASDGDDVVLYDDEARKIELTRFNFLRQQQTKGKNAPCRSLSDYVAPVGSAVGDWIGAFAVTAGLGANELCARYESTHDDYNAIMVKALADRMAEAYAEMLHQRARRDWGYGAHEALDNAALIGERYRGIRPAIGYPACPDHSEKGKLFALLEAQQIGMDLTESYAMTPAASVSGLYFAHPQARYFSLRRIGRDQVADYAKRHQMSIPEVERWLRPSLAYDADRIEAA